MSDIHPHHSIFKWKLCIEEPSLAYAAKNDARPALFAVGITYPLLKLWQEYMVNQKEKENLATAENENPCPSQYCLDYVNLFELSIPGDVFGITKDRIIRNEVNKFLEKFAGMELQRENENICDDLEKWKKSYKNLQEEKEKLYLGMVSALKEKDEEIKNLHDENKELLAYIDRLEEKHNFVNQGKDIAHVAKKSRTLKTFLSRAKIALWVME
ncbi:Hypothetical predicted protein [Paramuricea clavata]|uniref:Uncharacterized protein n=1 Tax=Paramuricea clavata TaxID=317549 RepID=A0A7D9IJC6_PARCT|nr:Hypothetical predicted protein [Paramuricea clavata]